MIFDPSWKNTPVTEKDSPLSGATHRSRGTYDNNTIVKAFTWSDVVDGREGTAIVILGDGSCFSRNYAQSEPPIAEQLVGQALGGFAKTFVWTAHDRVPEIRDDARFCSLTSNEKN